jgi:hypothetical protein
MGQRSQTFIKVHNPLVQVNEIYAEPPTDRRLLKRWDDAQAGLAKWRRALGTGKTTVLAFHHQWLYGLTYTALIHQLLNFYQHKTVISSSNHPLHMDYFMRSMGVGYETVDVALNRFAEFHALLMGVYSNPWKGTRDAGLESFTFLNVEEPVMRSHFDCGDNNDGICMLTRQNTHL